MDIYESPSFKVVAADEPVVSRKDGGHIVIIPKNKDNLPDLMYLDPKRAVELIRLTMIVGEAMTIALKRQGIDIGKINYQENGNWAVFKSEGPKMHIQVFGRAKSAKIQKYGEALYFPNKKENPQFYNNIETLNKEDVKAIKKEMDKLFKTKKYDDKNWHL